MLRLLEVVSVFLVIKNEVVIAIASTVVEAREKIKSDQEVDKLSLMLKRRLLKKLLKKNLPLNSSKYQIAEVIE